MAPEERIVISVDPKAVSSLPKGSYQVLDGAALSSKFNPAEIVKLEKQVFDFFDGFD